MKLNPFCLKWRLLTVVLFTVQNDFLDFPKQIKYRKEHDNLKALVSGDDLRIPFEFKIKNSDILLL